MSVKMAQNASALDFDYEPDKASTGPQEGVSNTSGSGMDNCTNDYCISDYDYIVLMTEHIYPSTYEWILILLHCLVFVVGLLGNALVCSAVYRNTSMRTVTNYFIVNLAAADFLVILCCLPPTVVWDVTETWFLGTALCKILLYIQTVSVAVSVLTLTFISVDRWYAICFPLKFKSTTSRAKTAIIVIWVVALLFDIPELVTLHTVPRQVKVETVLFTQCTAAWDDNTERHYTATKIVLLYTCPLLFMSVAYSQIVRVLWTSRNIPGHKRNRHPGGGQEGRRSFLLGGGPATLPGRQNPSTEGQLRSRRKAAKMLVAVVLMFAVCYFPVHLLSILRYTVNIPQNDTTAALSMMSHWLCYANSAVNPLIYNFMSGKYRKEFRRTFGTCCCFGVGDRTPSAGGGIALTSRTRGGGYAGGRRLTGVVAPARSPTTELYRVTTIGGFDLE